METQGRSVLQLKLTRLCVQLGKGGVIVAACTVVVLLLRYSITRHVVEGKPLQWRDLEYALSFLIIGVTVLVVSVPEGLPLAGACGRAAAVAAAASDTTRAAAAFSYALAHLLHKKDDAR